MYGSFRLIDVAWSNSSGVPLKVLRSYGINDHVAKLTQATLTLTSCPERHTQPLWLDPPGRCGGGGICFGIIVPAVQPISIEFGSLRRHPRSFIPLTDIRKRGV